MADPIDNLEKKEEESPTEEFLNWRQRNPDQPLFLPPNSIRALIIVWLLIIISIEAFNKCIDQTIMQLLSLCIGFYFGNRSSKTNIN